MFGSILLLLCFACFFLVACVFVLILVFSLANVTVTLSSSLSFYLTVPLSFSLSLQCTQWSQDVLEFLASQPMESPSYKQANFLIGRIDDFLFRVQPIQIQSLQELAAALPEEKVLQKSVQKSVQK